MNGMSLGGGEGWRIAICNLREVLLRFGEPLHAVEGSTDFSTCCSSLRPTSGFVLLDSSHIRRSPNGVGCHTQHHKELHVSH
jgi:hypothetical protein